MTTLPSPDVPAIFWIDQNNQQQGPEPLATVIERITHGQIPPSTPVWWQGAVNWAPFDSTPELSAALQPRDPAPAPAPQQAQDAPAFGGPTAQESQPTFATASAFEPSTAPSTFDAPAAAATFETPAVFETPASSLFAAPQPQPQPVPEPVSTPVSSPFETVVPAEAPATAIFEVPSAFAPAEPSGPTFDATPATDAVPMVVVPESTTYDLTNTPAAASAPVDAVIVTATGLDLGDPAELASTFAALTSRSEAFDADAARAANLDSTVGTMVADSAVALALTILETTPNDDYHTLRLSEPDGSPVALAVQRVPAALSVAAAIERPLACFVDRRSRATVGLFLGDYLGVDGSIDQALFTRHLASIIAAAG